MPEAAKLSNGAFRTLSGIDTTKHANLANQPDNITFTKRFTKSESRAIFRRIYVTPEDPHAEINSANISPYLKATHAKIGNKRVDTDKMRALAPEIEQSRILVSSSIMSPNDLQDGGFTFVFDNVSGVGDDPDLSNEIAETLSYYFNSVLNLGIKSYDWIGEIMYSSGCHPVLILPVATQMALRARTHEDVEREKRDRYKPFDFGLSKKVGLESFDDYRSRLSADADFYFSRNPVTWDSVLGTSEPSADLDCIIPALESFELTGFPEDEVSFNMGDLAQSDPSFRSGLESMILNLRTRLNEGDVIKVSENPEILRFGVTSKKTLHERMMGILAKDYVAIDKPVEESMIELDPDPQNFAHVGHPTIIELPPESVVPIYLHGATGEHLGYFILIDQDGQPLTIENSGMLEDTQRTADGSPSPAYEAVFGQGCCSTNNRFMSSTTDIANAGSTMFQYMLEKYLRARMEGIVGRGDLEVGRMGALASILFARLLSRKNTTLVYAPPELLHYFAFDYDHTDGIGVAKTDNIAHLLSLRATYMIAAVMAMANDAIEQKVVSFSVDNANANIEGYIDLITNIFIGKQKLTGSVDPSEIMRDVFSNNLTVYPRNLPGLQDFNIEVSNNSNQAQRPDNELIEQITNLIVSQLDVPPAALNQLAEPEYARSLVTYNLFFAKKISRYQRIWCSQIAEFIRCYLHFDIPLQQAILKKLQAAGKKRVDEKLPPKVRKLKDKNPNVYSRDTSAQMLWDIIANFEVRLPKPNIVVDTAQFEQIRQFLGNLDEMANQFFNQDMVPSEDTDAQTALPILRAMWKHNELKKFLTQVGNFNMVDIPDMDDIDDTELLDYIQTLQNLNRHLTAQRQTIAGMGENEMMGGGDEYGGDDEFGGDEDMGGDDMDMDMGEEIEEEPEEPEEPAESEPAEEPATDELESSSGGAAELYARIHRPDTKK